MGESKLKQTSQDETLMTCAGVQTVAGRVQIRWEPKSAATPMGQLAYFFADGARYGKRKKTGWNFCPVFLVICCGL